mmetsp:Transcript_28355/g.59885  ORF Transcript_28355/g.59885 Transcript_28355/m.59885 type:complete len:286 (-) Transcript_28355:176-1033(-)|eukprot:CAMPEP_0183711946 /NCGR_PEP_ID=MMETSP0737-20130205/7267_1 /TAXON_ID=385413 /ORGANISM="Thalassiosira miniscula, Strain CCMP1093" /LENGTH=285 /DNA_ID=CAMNT_0025940519 /DNA_START=57 /DNA_END=914 /DNA_ORIENTATION=-
MDRVTSSSQLSSVSSTSSLPSLAASRSISEEDQPKALRPQEQEATPNKIAIRSIISSSKADPTDAMTNAMMGESSLTADGAAASSALPFQSFRPLRPSGPFMTAISFACFFCSLSIASAATTTQQQQHQHNRRLEDEWTGEWDGEWAAPSDDYVYECSGDNCNDDNNGRGSEWYESDPDAMTPEEIITYVSIGIVVFFTMLCCVCYPEIMVLAYRKVCGCLCGCCGAGGGGAVGSGVSGGGKDENLMEGDYVGGAQDSESKRKRRKSRTRSSSRGKSREREVELV